MIDYISLAKQYEKYGRLTKSPIEEAVLACYHTLPSGFEYGDDFIRLLEIEFKESVWLKQPKGSLNLNIVFENGELKSTADHVADSFRFVSVIKSNIVLIIDGPQFAVCLQKPYTSWIEFSELAKAYWRKFVNISGATLSHYGLRFINKISFGLPLVDYLGNAYLQPSMAIGLDATNFQTSFEQKISGSPYFLAVGLSFQQTDVAPAKGDLLLDIGLAVSPDELDKIKMHDKDKHLEELQILKNHFFFTIIQPSIISLCQ